MKWDSIVAGLVVAGVNGALALVVIRWGWGKGMQVFMIAFFGGMNRAIYRRGGPLGTGAQMGRGPCRELRHRASGHVLAFPRV